MKAGGGANGGLAHPNTSARPSLQASLGKAEGQRAKESAKAKLRNARGADHRPLRTAGESRRRHVRRGSTGFVMLFRPQIRNIQFNLAT